MRSSQRPPSVDWPRRLGVLLTAALLAASGAIGAAAPAGAAAFDVRVQPGSGSQYLEPGATFTNLFFCTTEPAVVDIVVRDAAGDLVRTLGQGMPWSTLCDDYSAPQWDLTDDAGQGVPNGVYTVEISARTEAGATDIETFQRGVIRQQGIGEFTSPGEIRGAFEMSVQLAPWFMDIATVTGITLECYPGGVPTTIGSIDTVPPDGQALVPGDSSPCPLGAFNLLGCDLTWDDPFGVGHSWICDHRVTFAQPLPSEFEIGLVDNYSAPEEYRFAFEGPGRLSLCLSRSGTVDAVVRDASGNAVRTLATDQPFPASPCDANPPVSVLEWDYRDDGGAVVPDGDYRLELLATDSSGGTPPATAARTVLWHVSSLTPGEFTKPAPGDVVSGPETYEFVRTPGFSGQFPSMALSVGCAPSADFVPPGDEPVVGTWNAILCREGTVHLSAAALLLDPLGKVHVRTTPIPVTVFHPRVEPGVVTIAEGDAGTVTVDVPVTLSAPSHEPVTASWRATDGTASAGDDFASASGTVTFAPGETSKAVSITLIGDDAPEADEMVFVRFAQPANARLGGVFGIGFAIITDDDGAPVARPGSVAVTEGDTPTTAAVPLTLSESSTETVRVRWRTVSNSATAGLDFTAASGTATFAPGETETSVPIEVLGDDLAEGREIVVVAFENPENATVGGWFGLGFVIINDDDSS